ncbi:flagellar hook-length control protein FliK [Hirschia litorea]|uniref:Flagellar hook-length control protein FliK n=1 Tax=Hirschia litorea TaxID=1199156 RepID=A0ABW2IJZ4_9PROT
MIDGFNYSETKTAKSSLSKLDDTRGYKGENIDREYFRNFLNEEESRTSKARPNPTQKQTSSQESASTDASLMTINFFTAQDFNSNTSPSLSLETRALQNTQIAATDTHTLQNATTATPPNAQLAIGQTTNSNTQQTSPLSASATQPQAQALATGQSSTPTASETATSAPQTPTNQAAQTSTPHISAQNLAAIIKSPATPLTAADLNLVAQNTAKQTGTVATSTATNPNSALQIQTNMTQSGVGQLLSQASAPQGASAQFLQSTKGINTSNSANSGTTQSSTPAQSGQTLNTQPSQQTNPAFTAQAGTQNPSTTQPAGAPQPALLPSGEVANFADSSADADIPDLPETGFKDTNLASTTSAAQAKPTPDLPPGLRNANPVTQQAWAGIIQRLDGKSQQFQIRLDPAELGRINVSIEITKDKKATVTLAAKSAEALSELSRGSKALQDALSEAGVELEESGLKLELSSDDSSSFTFSDDDGSQTANKKGEVSKDADQSGDQHSNEPYQVTPEITAWSRMRVDLKA